MVSHFILISTHMPPPQCLLLTPFLTLSLFLITQSKLSFLSPLRPLTYNAHHIIYHLIPSKGHQLHLHWGREWLLLSLLNPQILKQGLEHSKFSINIPRQKRRRRRSRKRGGRRIRGKVILHITFSFVQVNKI